MRIKSWCDDAYQVGDDASVRLLQHRGGTITDVHDQRSELQSQHRDHFKFVSGHSFSLDMSLQTNSKAIALDRTREGVYELDIKTDSFHLFICTDTQTHGGICLTPISTLVTRMRNISFPQLSVHLRDKQSTQEVAPAAPFMLEHDPSYKEVGEQRPDGKALHIVIAVLQICAMMLSKGKCLDKFGACPN